MNDCHGQWWAGTRLALLCLVFFGPAMIGRSDARAQGAADTQLEIEIQRGAGLPVERYLLACNPPSGTVRDPAAACDRIADRAATTGQPSIGGSFPAGPTGQGVVMCPQIYGGPEIAFVRGRFAGAPVNARLSRENGCTMSSYDAAMKLLGVP
jgi:hypothetical protein